MSPCINRMKHDIWNNCWMLLFSDNQIGKNYIFHYTRYVWNTFIQIVKIFFSVTKNTSLHSSERYAPKNWSKLFISPSVMGRHLSNSVSPNWTRNTMYGLHARAEVTRMTSLKATTDIMQIFTEAVSRGPPQPYIGQSFQSTSRYEAHISLLSPWPFEDFPQRSQLCVSGVRDSFYAFPTSNFSQEHWPAGWGHGGACPQRFSPRWPPCSACTRHTSHPSAWWPRAAESTSVSACVRSPTEGVWTSPPAPLTAWYRTPGRHSVYSSCWPRSAPPGAPSASLLLLWSDTQSARSTLSGLRGEQHKSHTPQEGTERQILKCAKTSKPLTTESWRLGAGFAPGDLGVQGRVVDHQALQQGHSTVPSLGPQQIQHVAWRQKRKNSNSNAEHSVKSFLRYDYH